MTANIDLRPGLSFDSSSERALQVFAFGPYTPERYSTKATEVRLPMLANVVLRHLGIQPSKVASRRADNQQCHHRFSWLTAVTIDRGICLEGHQTFTHAEKHYTNTRHPRPLISPC